ncbi:type II toxin-antitoxin system VapC family toxin [Pararobbsia alpina]|uniref:Ribonuclease VapC22 n=1 Tax=Pararobbsia alpina TaxID=621374 RepID=A0A6S7AW86_9BURK|nr:type II toxin-antitoxin system VapC family toxin [Pararobbsia alpina]CAB3779094.1 Ribonuclease VapC22 [Pararobbsia alpina]
MITLDTHALVCWLSGRRSLSKMAREAIEKELNGGEILISAISALEVSDLVESGQLVLSMDTPSWLATVASIEGVRIVPVDTEIAFRAARLSPTLLSNQRIIVATARTFGGALVTQNPKVRALTHVETIW